MTRTKNIESSILTATTLDPTPRADPDKEQVLLKVVRHSNVEKSQGLLKGLDPETVQDVAESHEFSVLA